MTSAKVQYEIFTFPKRNGSDRPVMLAACPGGPGMTFAYLRDLMAPHPSLGIDWPRVDERGAPLRKQQLALDAQVTYLETCRQRASQQIGRDIKLVPVCHSASGPRGILWAARYPEHVAGLVLIDAVIGPSPLPYSAARLLLGLLAYRCLHPKAGLEDAFRARFMRLVGRYYFVYPAPDLQQTFTDAFVSPFMPSLLESGMAGWDAREPLKTLRAPILLIHGAEDQIIAPARSQQQQAALGSQAALCLIPGAGHMPMLEQPAATAEALGAFLQNHLVSPVELGENTRL